jgi:membrane-associated protease RseP (regulator of RpoE activity)
MMKNRHIALIAGVLLIAATAAGATAQNVISRVQQPRAWLGFSFLPVDAGLRGDRRPAIVIVEVVEDSPAERAGLAVDDTVLSINDIRVSDDFVSSLSSSLEPGDRVRLRIRRDGREREITVEAGRRPVNYGMATPRSNTWSYTISPDSMRGQLRLYLDSARIALDTMRFPEFRVETTPGGGVWMFTDSSRVRLLPDSAWFGSGRALILPRDSYFLRADTMAFSGALPGVRAFSFRADSLFEHMDSMFMRAMPRGFSLQLDTMRMSRSGMQLEGGRIFGLRGDSVFTFETLPGGAGIARFGMTAIAGAELTELNEGLGEYFGADAGVLVVRVPDRTPAARAGLEAGDVIVRANGRDVTSVSELRRAVARSGDAPVRLDIIRRNSRRTIELRQ